MRFLAVASLMMLVPSLKVSPSPVDLLLYNFPKRLFGRCRCACLWPPETLFRALLICLGKYFSIAYGTSVMCDATARNCISLPSCRLEKNAADNNPFLWRGVLRGRSTGLGEILRAATKRLSPSRLTELTSDGMQR